MKKKGTLTTKLNIEQILEAKTAWYNGESLRSLGRKYKIHHTTLKMYFDENYKEVRKNQANYWRDNNLDKIIFYKKRWYLNNKEYVREWMNDYNKK